MMKELFAKEGHDNAGILSGDLAIVVEVVTMEYNLTQIALRYC
jgi:hypothetical protein